MKLGEHEQAKVMLLGELTTLNFSLRSIWDDGADIVADFLKHDKTVKEVHLISCQVGPRGAKVIAEALKLNRSVESMNISGNRITFQGAEALTDAVRRNACITWLFWNRKISFELIPTVKYITETRNKILIPAAVRRASLCLIAARYNISTAGALACFPKEIVKMIAMEVWATRKEPIWINALPESERTGEAGD